MERVFNRIGRDLVRKFRIPPHVFGFRHMRTASPAEFDYTLIEPPGTSSVALPLNIQSRDLLSRNQGKWGFSFFDVPDRPVRETFIASVPNCRILSQFDQYGEPDGNEYYALVTEDDRVLNVRGTGYNADLHRKLLTTPSSSHGQLRSASWVLELWDRNYSHWIQWHLVKIALLQKHGLAGNLILPREHRLSEVVRSSIEALGVDVEALPRMGPKVLHVDQLTVVGMDDYRASLIVDLRARIGIDSKRVPSRRIFISRRKATRRRLVNEEDCWRALSQFGFERVFMEELDFRGQVALMQEAAVLFGLHGSGLANMLFAPRGLHVIEIVDPTFPNPQFYALAGAIGHQYWLIRCLTVGDPDPGYNDVEVDIKEVEQIVRQVEAALEESRHRDSKRQRP